MVGAIKRINEKCESAINQIESSKQSERFISSDQYLKKGRIYETHEVMIPMQTLNERYIKCR